MSAPAREAAGSHRRCRRTSDAVRSSFTCRRARPIVRRPMRLKIPTAASLGNAYAKSYDAVAYAQSARCSAIAGISVLCALSTVKSAKSAAVRGCPPAKTRRAPTPQDPTTCGGPSGLRLLEKECRCRPQRVVAVEPLELVSRVAAHLEIVGPQPDERLLDCGALGTFYTVCHRMAGEDPCPGVPDYHTRPPRITPAPTRAAPPSRGTPRLAATRARRPSGARAPGGSRASRSRRR